MISIRLSNVSLMLGSHTLFAGLNWNIQDGQKIGLIGPNGAGKSSLLKLITGEFQPEPGGNLVKARSVSLGYLAQQPELDPQETVFDTALSGNPRWLELETELNHIEADLGQPYVYNNPNALARLLEKQQKFVDEYLAIGGDRYPERVKEILSGLGIAESDFQKPVSALSGGQKKLVGLARLLLSRPSVLLLDEPDNHLDLSGKAFLERLIADYSGTVVIVSHDRYLLDAVVTHIVELEDGKLFLFAGDYSTYVLEKEIRLARQEQLFQIQQREIARLEAARKRYALWAQRSDAFASRLHAMEARISRIEQLDRPVIDRRQMDLELNGWRGSTKVLEITKLKKSFGTQEVLSCIDLLVWHGERTGLIGANGVGKSVLFRLILGQETPDGGEIRIGPSVTIGYHAQEHQTLNLDQTLIDSVRRAIPDGTTMTEASAVSFLNRYLFPYRMVNQTVRQLSGGERSRLQLALLVLSGANFLLLDEPTNNLDIASAEVLENALEDFQGTVLVISHDRYFLDRVVNRILELKDGKLVEYSGGYSDYAAKAGVAVHTQARS